MPAPAVPRRRDNAWGGGSRRIGMGEFIDEHQRGRRWRMASRSISSRSGPYSDPPSRYDLQALEQCLGSLRPWVSTTPTTTSTFPAAWPGRTAASHRSCRPRVPRRERSSTAPASPAGHARARHRATAAYPHSGGCHAFPVEQPMINVNHSATGPRRDSRVEH